MGVLYDIRYCIVSVIIQTLKLIELKNVVKIVIYGRYDKYKYQLFSLFNMFRMKKNYATDYITEFFKKKKKEMYCTKETDLRNRTKHFINYKSP